MMFHVKHLGIADHYRLRKDGHMGNKRKKPGNPTHVVAIMNQKGGVGKTTTAVNVAAAIGEMGYKVLVVDLDPQGNTTSGFGVEKDKVENSVYDMLLGDNAAQDAVLKVDSKNISILPSTIQLAGAEIELVSVTSRETRVKDALADVKDEYDYVFMDCPPSLGILTMNALTAATDLLVPIQCEYYALEGVAKLLETTKMVKAHLNPSLELLGVVMTMYDKRTTLSRQVVKEVKGYFGYKVFKTMIPRNVRLSEAPSYGQPIVSYAPKSKGAESYRKLAKEVVARG